MFGRIVDYHLLRPFAKSQPRGRPCTARDLPYSLEDARSYLTKARNLYFDDEFPVNPSLSYLDVGCNTGRLSIALGLAGITDVTGIDLRDGNVRRAKAVAKQLPADRRPRFVNANFHDCTHERRYDVILAVAVLEHIERPALFLRSLCRLLKPGGRAFVSMTPFHGPFGDHMSKFFRVQIPWRGALFSEEALLRLRRECHRPEETMTRFQDLAGGLNLMKVDEYFRHIRDAGLTARHIFDPHFRHYPRYWPLVPLSWCASKVPGVRNYLTVNVYSILRRSSSEIE